MCTTAAKIPVSYKNTPVKEKAACRKKGRMYHDGIERRPNANGKEYKNRGCVDRKD
jgi:hypothetical protein